jgi:hypothetical protein
MMFRSFRRRQITPPDKQPNIRFFCNTKKSSFFQAVVHLYGQFSKEIKLVIGTLSITGSAVFY